MTNEEIMQHQADARAFAATDAGGAFVKFERALHTAVITDQRENASDRAMTRDWDASNAARKEAVAAIKKLLRVCAAAQRAHEAIGCGTEVGDALAALETHTREGQ